MTVGTRHSPEQIERTFMAADRYPAVRRSDNGPELACSAMSDLASGGVGLDFDASANLGPTASSSRLVLASSMSVSALTALSPRGRPAVGRAARSGLEGKPVDLTGPINRPAAAVITDLVNRLRPQLEAVGDWTTSPV